MKVITDEKKIKAILSRNVEQIIGREELEKKLRSGRQLRIKHGVDVTSPMLHLGHAVDYWKMREFQELGHKVVFIIGDFTSRIGDPTGRLRTRPELAPQKITRDSKKYLAQATKILINKPGLLEVRRNSGWYQRMRLLDFLALARKVTHARVIERDMFQRRIQKREEIYIPELLYPILQGYDSFVVKADLTVIGSDQLFNELMGRHFQEIFSQEPQAIITTPITPGLDGKEKMSKSLGNYIAILDSPQEKFGKIMSIPDKLIGSYLVVYTKLPLPEIEKVKKSPPLEAKERLAFEIVKLYHGEKVAEKAREFFVRTFRERKIPEGTRVFRFHPGTVFMVDILKKAKVVPSNSEFRRLLNQGAIEFNQEVLKDPSFKPASKGTVRIGKKRFLKIIPK